MSSVNKTAGGHTPQARRFDAGLEDKQQGAQWRDLFDGFESDLGSPGVGLGALDSPVTPRTRSVLESPVQPPQSTAARNDGASTSWAGFNPFFSHS